MCNYQNNFKRVFSFSKIVYIFNAMFHYVEPFLTHSFCLSDFNFLVLDGCPLG